jgi:hypothetical protein
VIFYTIYKNQEITFTISVALLQGGPRKDLGFRNVVLGAGSGGLAAIPAGDRRGPAGGW